MSASLVGSEMCIRDRFSKASAPCSGARSRCEDATTARLPARAGGAVSISCLLYTSDAADDM
eukprot:5454747-Alexandrium_andersonii.AAC.1